MKRFVAAAVAAKMSYAGLFQFRGMPLSSIRVVFLGLFDDWRQGSVATSMMRSAVSSSNARAARFRTVAGSPNRAFAAARARRWLGARAGKRAKGTARFAEAGLLESARVPRAVGLPGAAGVLVALLSGCALGPDYVRPSAIASADSGAKDLRSADFKERKGWKPMAPSDLADRGAWWTVYREPELDRLVASRGGFVHYIVGARGREVHPQPFAPRFLSETIPDIKQRDVFVCGPREMIDAVLSSLRALRVPATQVHCERFAFLS